MTTRHAGYLVVLEEDIREDSDQHVVNALKMVKGVVAVTPVEGSYEVYIAEERIRYELYDKVVAAIREAFLRKST